MVPGKTYRPEDYLEILWRRKWIGIVPFVLIAIGTMIGTQFIPNRYRSSTQVLVVPQQVPKDYVEPTVTSALAQRLQAITQQILSRTRLERVIQDFNLYPEQRKTELMEDVVALMRRDIDVTIGRAGRRSEPSYFTVSFEYGEPRTAMQVTDRLASLFISENLQDRTVQADQTSQFLQTQLDDARRRLTDHEQKLEEFRRQYAGQLPTQVQTNLQVMQSTQAELQAVNDSINHDRDRQMTLDKLMSDLVTISSQNQANQAPAKSDVPLTAAQQLAQARESLQALLTRLKPEHPDVMRAQRVVKELEQKAAAEELNAPVGVTGTPVRLSAGEQKRLSDMQAERDSLDRHIATSRAEEARLQGVLASYRDRVEAAPAREAQLTGLMRDYDTLEQSYKGLLAKSQESDIAADLERRQIGEQFRVIDPARLPERPISPNRPRFNGMGAAGGLIIGLALIALLEYRDTSVRTDEDVTLSLALPVLAVIPLMITSGERKRNRRRTLAAATASLVLMMSVLAFAVWKMDLIPGLVR